MPRSRPRVLRVARVRFRLMMRRMERETPGWMRWLTPWGTSLALHALLIMVLAVLVTALAKEERSKNAPIFGQLTDDVTSANPSDHAGDPFTTLKGDEPPSLSLEPNPPPMAEIRTPRLPDSFVIGPTVNTSAREPAGLTLPKESAQPSKGPGRATVSARGPTEGAGAFDARIPLMAPFSGRSVEGRARMVRREG